MVLQTRNSVFAITKETTEGTPVVPSAATDFLAFQEGFTIKPAFEELKNNELQASIDLPKPALGVENVSATVSHYLRNSGVEGTEPNYKHLLECTLGTKNVNGTERLTAAASTTSVVKLAAGGADFARGRAILLKDGVNGYSIRNVLTVSTNDLNLAQNLAVAPGAGLGVGKCSTYATATTGHPTLDLWVYRANQGAVEMMSGSRVTNATIDITAGQFINTAFTLEGIQYFFDPMIVTASNKWFDFDEGAAEINASVTVGTYKDPYELAQALEDAINALATANFTVSYSDITQKYTIVSDGATFNIKWKTGTHGSDNTDTHIGTLLGFSDAANSTGGLTYTSGTSISFAAAYTPSYDSASPLAAKYNEVMIGDATEYACFGAKTVKVTIANTKADIMDICSVSGKSATILSQREITIDVVSYLSAGQALEFKRFRNNDEILFTYNMGERLGGNWVAGKCVNLFSPTVKINSLSLEDDAGIVTLNLQLKTFVKDGLGTFYINCL